MFPNLTNDDGQYLDQVQLTGMLLSCVIGIFSNERSRKQPVTVDLCLYLNTRRAAETTHIHDTIDYAAAVKEVSFILEQCAFLLIETAVDTVCKYFLATYTTEHRLPAVEAIVVRISKPSALTHGIIPSVQILRRRGDYEPQLTASQRESSCLLHGGPDGSLYLVRARPGLSPLPSELISTARSALTIGRWNWQGQPVKPRTTINFKGTGSGPDELSHDAHHEQLVIVRSSHSKQDP